MLKLTYYLCHSVKQYTFYLFLILDKKVQLIKITYDFAGAYSPRLVRNKVP